MNKELIKVFLAILSVLIILPCYSQSFEGTISLRTFNDLIDNTFILTIKGDKTVLEAEIDSIEMIKIIKDYGAESTTLLRRKNDLKYGFRISSIPGPGFTAENIDNEKSEITIETTDEVKRIGPYRCVKVTLNSPFAASEAWITNDFGFSLSKYFPEFLGTDEDQHLYDLRNAAEKKGFVMSYRENLLGADQEKIFEVTIEEKEISSEAFKINAEYLVLDEKSMMQFYSEAQRNEMKKKQWEEFNQLFGHK